MSSSTERSSNTRDLGYFLNYIFLGNYASMKQVTTEKNWHNLILPLNKILKCSPEKNKKDAKNSKKNKNNRITDLLPK